MLKCFQDRGKQKAFFDQQKEKKAIKTFFILNVKAIAFPLYGRSYTLNLIKILILFVRRSYTYKLE